MDCDRDGRHKPPKTSTQSASKKCRCPSNIRSTSLKDGLRWKVEIKCGVYNHGLPDRLESHAFIGRLIVKEHKYVKDLTNLHVPSRHILLSLQKQYP